MGYIRAEQVLPAEVIELIQQYVDGANIYVPKKSNNYVGWGQANHTKEKIQARNHDIYQDYLQGIKVNELAEKYYLSQKSIWRILRKMKNNC